MSFTHLHVHSEYSLLDGMGKLTELAHHTRDLGMDALALTDHGNLYGAQKFYLACKEAGIKPILGVEAYVAPGDHLSKTAVDRDPSHLILLAKNETGWRNLIRLVTRGQVDGFYYKPRVDHALLSRHSEGLAVLSGCLNAEVPKLILQGRLDDARATVNWYRDVFGDYFFELQSHAIPELDPVNKALVELSREMGIPLVATNDSHYVKQSDSYPHDVLLCIQTNATIHEEKRFKFSDDSCYLKSPAEMAALFPNFPEAMANTNRVADLCNVEMDFSRLYLPEYRTPNGAPPDEYLAALCWAGLKRRYREVTEPLERRLDYELDVIRKTQFANYFLVVWDILRFARESGILYGVRGSAAASIVLYCLDITEIDPVGARLVFERFLNVERKELPDIDMDFADDRRDEMIGYVAQKYGQDHVAQIITFGTLGAKAAIRDVARALGMSYGEGDRVARLIPAALHMTLDRALDENPELQTLYQQDATVQHLVDTARQLEGTARHASTHAAGVVISQEPLQGLVPLQRLNRSDNPGNMLMTQWSMEDVAHAGLLKMDFLGLINLTILGKARDLIKQTRGIDLDLQQIPLDDGATYDLLSSAETTGVFQLESPGMRRAIRDLRPRSLGELAALVALYRPGPMQHIQTYIESKHGRQQIRYPHQALAEILEETYGVIVYQDQVLLILQRFAGYSLGQADIVRKAMGKKIAELMQAERSRFLQGALEKGFSEEQATEVFDLIEPFAGYAFNKAHATSYALIAYQTAYLKANHAPEYMAALMTGYGGNSEKLAGAVAECGRLGVPVLPPDINRSGLDFTVESMPDVEGGGTLPEAREAGVVGQAGFESLGQQGPQTPARTLAVRFGLAVIKNVGAGAVECLLAPRNEEGPFTSIEDLCRRVDLGGVNKRTLESLIKAGALDGLGPRGALLAGIDRLLAAAQREQKMRESGQTTMFDLWGESVPVPLQALDLPGGDVPLKEKLAWEKELLGVYVSQHPFSAVAAHAARDTTALCGQIDADLLGQTVTLAGMVATVRPVFTKDGRTFASVVLEDLEGAVEVTVWPEVYERTRELWTEGELLLVHGKVNDRRGTVQVTCDAAQKYEVPPQESTESWQGEEPFAADSFVKEAPLAASTERRRMAGPASLPPQAEEPIPALAAAPAPAGSFNGDPPGAPRPAAVFVPARPALVRAGYGGGTARPDGGNANGTGGGHVNGNGHTDGNGRRRALTVELRESSDPDRDLSTFQALMAVLQRHQGNDPVRLTVFSGGTAERLELAGLTVRLSDTLLTEVRTVVGDGAAAVDA